ncbi:hypothetical protein V5O48_012114 [Marasmius crinis-equi]|uniref:Uncharacterized protein n=1 Tax=Marasmius crinis-equi TaxID=585013 RepID=A0ABR3F3V1_9AGAR
MVQLLQASTVDNSASSAASAATPAAPTGPVGGVPDFPPPSTTLVPGGYTRSPSPIDRSTGLSFIGYPAIGRGSHSLPRHYTSTTSDNETNTTLTQVTVEHVRVPGLVITTTTKVQFEHPAHFLNMHGDSQATSNSTQSATSNSTEPATNADNASAPVARADNGNDSDYDVTDTFSDSDDSETYSIDDSIADAYLVPSPAVYTRPTDETGPFHVVAAGRDVGIFQGDWDTVVRSKCLGVRNSHSQRFENWDDALYQYARCYQRCQPGWEIQVLDTTSTVIYDTTYSYSKVPGPGVHMLGVVDITGLDLDPSRVTKIARV